MQIWLGLLLALVEVAIAAMIMGKLFGRPALRQGLMRFNMLAAALLLWLKNVQLDSQMGWFCVDFMLLFLLAVVHKGEIQQQALLAVVLAGLFTLLEWGVRILL